MEIIRQYWYIIFALIGYIVWLVRLEGKIKINAVKIKVNEDNIIKLNMDNRKQFDGLSEALKENNALLNKLNAAISNLEGKISMMIDHD